MKPYFHAWNLVFEGMPKPFWAVLNTYQNLKLAWDKASESRLFEIGVRSIYLKKLRELRKTLDPSQEFSKIIHQDIKVLVCRDDDEYPPQLKNLNNHLPPAILYVKGKIPSSSKAFVSIVGTRQMTGYGESVTKQIVRTLQGYNLVITSGMAYGIDSTAHKAALENKMQTVAVLGFGLNRIPHYLRQFAYKISRNGALVSEYPPDLEAQKWHFPLRNRIISGLSKATIVVEAGERSGASITAQYALDQGREVFAVPGNIYNEKSKGTNRLIKTSSATLLKEPEDILETLSIPRHKDNLILHLSQNQKIVAKALIQKPLSLNELERFTNLIPQSLNVALTELELNGLIQKNRGGRYFII
ncbi:DNA-processing protein DprA [Patescibacteria group bacterium]